MIVDMVPLRGLPDSAVERWRALGAATAEPNPFAEADFARSAARHLAGGETAQLLQVVEQGELVLALPVQQQRRHRRLPVPTLATWAHEYAFLGTPLVRPGREQASWDAVLTAVGGRGTAWLALTGLAADRPAAVALRAAGGRRRPGVLPVTTGHRATAVRSTGTGTGPPLSAKHRKDLRRQRRRLGEAAGGDVELVVRRGCPEAVEQFLRLEAAGWKGRSGTAMASAGHAGLLRDLTEQWTDRVEVLLLQAGGRTLAAQVDLRAGRTSFCFKTAYDERYAQHSPGLLLMLDALDAFWDDPDLDVLDSCAVPGHPMADRLFPDRTTMTSCIVPLTARGTAAAVVVPALRAYGRRPLPPRQRP